MTHSSSMNATGSRETTSDRLPSGSVYRSTKSRDLYLQYYEDVLAGLPFETQGQNVETYLGTTRINSAGDPSNPTLLVLAGMSVASPMMLEFFQTYRHQFHLIAPDLIGQPGRSQDRKMPKTKHAYARWLADVMDALEIESAHMAGASFGASISLDMAVMAPERVKKMALIVPAGLTPSLPYNKIVPLFSAWLAYRYLPYRPVLRSIANPLAKSMTEENLDYLDVVLRHTAFWRHRPAGPFNPTDLSNYQTPVFLVQSGQDIMFPHGPTRKNAEASLKIGEEHFFPNSAHMPGDDEMEMIHQRIQEFIGTR